MLSNIAYSDRVYAPTCAVTATWSDADTLLPEDLPGPFVYRVTQRNDPTGDVLYRVAVLTDFAGVSVSRTAALRGLKGLSSATDITPSEDLVGYPFYFSPTVRLTAGSIPALNDLVAAMEQRVENLVQAYDLYEASLAALQTTTFPLANAAIVTQRTDEYLAAVADKADADAALVTAQSNLTLKTDQYTAASGLVSSLDTAIAAWTTMRATTSSGIAAYAALVTSATTAAASLGAGATRSDLETKLVLSTTYSSAVINTAEQLLGTTLGSQKTAAEGAAATAKTAKDAAALAVQTAETEQDLAAAALQTAIDNLTAVCPDYPFPD
jgi:hypothetical protein